MFKFTIGNGEASRVQTILVDDPPVRCPLSEVKISPIDAKVNADQPLVLYGSVEVDEELSALEWSAIEI